MDNYLQRTAIQELLDAHNREKNAADVLATVVEACPNLDGDLQKHRYMAGVYKTMADEMSGPRANLLHSAAWNASVCPACEARLRGDK